MKHVILVMMIVIITCCNVFSDELQDIQSLMDTYGKRTIVYYISQITKDRSITIQVKNKLYLKNTSQSLDYVTVNSLRNDFKRLNISASDVNKALKQNEHTIQELIDKYGKQGIMDYIQQVALKSNTEIKVPSLDKITIDSIISNLIFCRISIAGLDKDIPLQAQLKQAALEKERQAALEKKRQAQLFAEFDADLKQQGDCYDLGYKYGRCGVMSMRGLTCDPDDDIIIPIECRGKEATSRGMEAGAKSVW